MHYNSNVLSFVNPSSKQCLNTETGLPFKSLEGYGTQVSTWPRCYKTFSFSTQLSMNLSCSIIGILTFISMINTSSESLKAKQIFIFQHCSFYEQLNLHAQLS